MSKKGRKEESSKEVEELLSVAEDQMLLDLRTGSHTARDSSIDNDLLRRFEALKKAPSSSSGITRSPLQVPPAKDKERAAVVEAKVDEELNRILGADLSSRFAALKGTSSSSSSRELQIRPEKSDDGDEFDENGVSKKEVDKLIQWAMDAARLDPSMSSDDDVDVDDDDDDDDVNEVQRKKNKGKRFGQLLLDP